MVRRVLDTALVNPEGLLYDIFMGGQSFDEDISNLQHCQIVITTPGKYKE
jgi:superfamily II DNA/RNA helicase